MPEKKHHTNWEQDWLEGQISNQDASKHAQDSDLFKVLSSYVDKASSLGVSEKTTKEEAWKKIESRIAEAPQTKVVSINRRYWLTGVAASFIIIISAFFLLDRPSESLMEVSTALAETQTIYLPDSSIVHLNAETHVSYSKKGWETERVIELSGEAFFEVRRGSNFTVTTSNGKVEVLGTSFNVRSRGDLMAVACKTGKVRVTTFGTNEMKILTPGLQTRVKASKAEDIEEVNAENVDSWRSGEYFLERSTIEEGFDELERLFAIEVVHELDNVDLERVGNWIFNKDDMSETIQQITISMGLTYQVDGSKVIIKERTR